jgi:ElaB/YqjD/DUF883 family membrane-anchored ribosome-binding protein
MPLKRPLDPAAVKAADAKLAEKTGGRKLTMGPEDKALREEWLEEYKRAAGDDPTPPPSDITCTVLPCGLIIYGFVARYRYADKTGVAGAQYVIRDMGDKELGKGQTDAEGRCRQDNIETPYAYVQFNKDPHPNLYFPQPPNEPITPEESKSALEETYLWWKGLVWGDFNDNQSTSQIIVTALIGLVPGLGQIMAGRDLVANMVKLLKFYETKYERSAAQIKADDEEFFGLGKEFMLWLFIVLNALQAFPELGPAVSGVVRLLFKELGKAAKAATPARMKVIFEELAKVLNWFGKHNAKKWLTEIKGKWPSLMAKAKSSIEKLFVGMEAGIEKLKGGLSSIEGMLGEKGKQATKYLEQLKSTIGKARKAMPEQLEKIEKNVAEKLNGIENETHGGTAKETTTPTEAKHTQEAKKPPELEGLGHTKPRISEETAQHIKGRDMSVPRKRGIGGAHNSEAFDKALTDEGGQVVSRTKHPSVDGVEVVEYKMPALDAKGKPTGEMKNTVFKKTVYDPKKISDEQMMKWGEEAAQDAAIKGPLPREWSGTTKDGVPIHGYADKYGNVTSFFVE